MKSIPQRLNQVHGGQSSTAAGQAAATDEPDVPGLVEGITAFALDLHSKAPIPGANAVFSPFSISAALAMTAAGARGETARQLQTVLHVDRLKSNIHGAFAELDAALKAAQGQDAAELIIANSLWPQIKYPFREEFLDLVTTHYRASVTPVDYFGNREQSRATINAWVNNKTHHKIPEIIDPDALDELTRLVLVNAVYFKGVWASPFLERRTEPDKFHLLNGKEMTVPFMNQTGQFRYADDGLVQVLALPYSGGRLEMILLLPREPHGLETIEKKLNATNLQTWTSKARMLKVHVALPKFRMFSMFDLAEALQALGVRDGFDGAKADFSGMDGQTHWLFLSGVLHRAFIEVNEQGTEAAAATGVAVAGYISREPLPREFRADHPFLFLIRETTTRSILFLGRVVAPEHE